MALPGGMPATSAGAGITTTSCVIPGAAQRATVRRRPGIALRGADENDPGSR